MLRGFTKQPTARVAGLHLALALYALTLASLTFFAALLHLPVRSSFDLARRHVPNGGLASNKRIVGFLDKERERTCEFMYRSKSN